MLCQKCNHNEATVHVRQNLNGEVREIHLCPQCAAELGYDSIFSGLENVGPFSGFQMGLQSLLGGLFSQELPQTTQRAPARKCSFCGTSFEDFAQSAMAGCAHCYSEFLDEMMPYIQRIHGRTRHVGKIPATAGRELKKRRELSQLRKALEDAVAAQEYEQAAKLRDQIKAMEKGEQNK